MKKTSLLALLIIMSCAIGYSQPFNVEDYGAKSDNKSDNTKAIQKAIDAAAGQGGGTVFLSGGIYLSGSIELKSNVHLQIAPGATLKALAKPEAIRKFKTSVISRLDVVPWKAFIYADEQDNIMIYGGGTIDASGDAECFRDGIENSPNRHYGIFIVNSTNIVVKDLSLRSSAFWMQRYFSCTGVRVQGLRVYNHANKNNDGIDIDSSEDVIISDCQIDASDDAIVLKSNGERPCRNVTVTNCIIASHASAFKLGTGSVGGFENITVSNIVIRRSKSKEMLHPLKVWEGLTGIDILTTDGGVLRQVVITNIVMDDVQNPIHIRLGNRLSGNVAKQGYGEAADKAQGVKDDGKSTKIKRQFVLEDVMISNVTAHGVGPYPVIIAGHEGQPVRRITLRDISIVCGKAGNEEDLTKEVYWAGNGYPGRGMYGTRMPAYGLVTNFVEDLVIENFTAIPAGGDTRPMEWHFGN